jgi:hypothetical protein
MGGLFSGVPEDTATLRPHVPGALDFIKDGDVLVRRFWGRAGLFVAQAATPSILLFLFFGGADGTHK